MVSQLSFLADISILLNHLKQKQISLGFVSEIHVYYMCTASFILLNQMSSIRSEGICPFSA